MDIYDENELTGKAEEPGVPEEPASAETFEEAAAENAEETAEETTVEAAAETAAQIPADDPQPEPPQPATVPQVDTDSQYRIRFETSRDGPTAVLTKTEEPEKKKRHAGVWLLVALLVCALVAEPFVFSALREKPVSISGTMINDYGELVISYSDGSSEILGTVVGKDGKDGTGGGGSTTIINAEGSGDISAAAAQGLRSAVSVWCTFMEEGPRGYTSEYYSAGSGVIYMLDKQKGNAFVITNYHVVFDSGSRTANGIAEKIQLYLYGSEISGSEITATYVGGSQYYDIAVLYVEDSEVLRQSDAAAATLGNSDDVWVGSTAIAIGNPEGDGISASYGVVSVDSEYITLTAADGYTSVDYRVMRIDTAVNSGNSGGGLYDGSGRLIGIVNAKAMIDGVENIGYALPVSTVTAVADNIIDYCYNTDCESVQRAMLGVTVMTTGSSAVYDSESGRVSIEETVEIYSVTEGQIGEAFRVGDVLVSAEMNGVTKQLTRQHHLIDLLLTARPGDVVHVTVLRDGRELTLDLTITSSCLTAY